MLPYRPLRSFLRGSIVDFSQKQNLIFWVSQVMVILATIIGVYLASASSVRNLVDFNELARVEKNYKSLLALREEVAFNNQLIKQRLEVILVRNEDGKIVAHNGKHFPELTWFIYDVLSKDIDSLELPPTLLVETSRYRMNLIDNIDRAKQAYPLNAMIELYDYTTEIESQLLVSFDNQLLRYEQLLAEKGASVPDQSVNSSPK